MSKLSLFDIVKNLNGVTGKKKENRWYEFQSIYSVYMINKFLSMHTDTVLFVNVLNKHDMNPQDHYEFLLYYIPAKRRYGKYVKEEKDDNVYAIAEYFDINKERAKEYIRYLKGDILTKILTPPDLGGIVK